MRALMLLSGGLDSTVMLAAHKNHYAEVIGLNITYGQRHTKEIEAAKRIAAYYDVELIQMDLTPIFEMDSVCSLLQRNSSLELPTGRYTPEVPSTYVPYRNGLFLSVATSIAYMRECDVIYYGAHMDDCFAAYPDCTAKFVDAQAAAIHQGTGGKVKLKTPYILCRKKDIVEEGMIYDVPFMMTWSCYRGGERPCGQCATCIDRKAAFEAAGVI